MSNGDQAYAERNVREIELDIENRKLKEENEKLGNKVKQLERVIDVQTSAAAWLTKGSILVTVGPSLVDAIKKWIESLQRDGKPTSEETASLLAAIVRAPCSRGSIKYDDCYIALVICRVASMGDKKSRWDD